MAAKEIENYDYFAIMDLKENSMQQENLLTILEEVQVFNGKRNRAYFKCKCKCGNVKLILKQSVVSRKQKSCGCVPKFSTHGKSKGIYQKTYNSWLQMRHRCITSTSKSYKDYGGRGIKVCDRWLNSFENFLEDMGIRPDNKTLDRIDFNGNYTIENCKWSTIAEQNSNKRNCKAKQ